MGSNKETVSKKLIHAKAKMPEIQSLKEFGKLLTGKNRKAFNDKYGKILALMEVDVQVEVVTALAQFYDPPMRCFTFQDFQMAPTLEEYEQILGYPLENAKPYHYIGHYPSHSTVASLLKVEEGKLKANMKNPNDVDGFPLAYLEERLKSLSEGGDWVAFMDVLALAIFGIVLFPQIDNHVDFAAIDVFMAVRNRGENPVTAVLADTYYILNTCQEKKKKRISCCLHALYVWLITHIFQDGRRALCPIVDSKWCSVKTKSKPEWAQYLRDLNEKTIRWYPKWQEVNEVIYQCGSFPNVPLLGTKGCINYNPSISLRQLCYPVMHPPAEESITPFIVYGINKKDTEEHKRIRQAWNQIIRKGKVLGKRSTDTKESYHQWIKDRVQKIKLPFNGTPPPEQEMHEPIPITNEEVEELKASLLKSEGEKEGLQAKLEKALQENRNLRSENTLKGQFIDRSNKRAIIEEKSKHDVQLCLRGANEELKLRNQERDKAIDNAYMWKELWTKSLVAEKNMQGELVDLKQQLKKVVAEYENRVKNERQGKEEIKEMLVKYQDALKKEREDSNELRNYIEYQEKIYDDLKNESMYWEDRFTKLVTQLENQEIFKELRNEGMYWRDCFSKLAGLANQAIADIPRRVEEADVAMHPLNTPTIVYKFIEYCKNLIEELREKAGCPIKKRKRAAN